MIVDLTWILLPSCRSVISQRVEVVFRSHPKVHRVDRTDPTTLWADLLALANLGIKETPEIG